MQGKRTPLPKKILYLIGIKYVINSLFGQSSTTTFGNIFIFSVIFFSSVILAPPTVAPGAYAPCLSLAMPLVWSGSYFLWWLAWLAGRGFWGIWVFIQHHKLTQIFTPVNLFNNFVFLPFLSFFFLCDCKFVIHSHAKLSFLEIQFLEFVFHVSGISILNTIVPQCIKPLSL